MLVPIRGDATQTSGDMSKEIRTPQFKILRRKTKPFTLCTCPVAYEGPSWHKQLIKELQDPAPDRSRFGESNPKRCNQNRSTNKSDRDIKLFHTGNLGNPLMTFTFHNGQSTADRLAREGEGKEKKPRTRPTSYADVSSVTGF